MYNPFHFIDIYATKGIEYLWVLGYLAVFVPFIMFLRKGRAEAPQPALQPAKDTGWFAIPDGLFYHLGHSWAKPLKDGTVLVGLDQFARKLVGRIQGLDVPAVGQQVVQGETGWSMSANGRKVRMVAPVDGEVIAVNDTITRAPHVLDEDTYDQGWLFRVRPSALNANLRNLLTAQKNKLLINEAMQDLFAQQNPDFGLVYQDGGQPVDGLAMAIDPVHWDRIAAKYLLTDPDQ